MNTLTDSQSDILMIMPVDLEVKATDILPAAQRVNKRYNRQFVSGALIALSKKDLINRVIHSDGNSSFVKLANGTTKPLPSIAPNKPKSADTSLQLGERTAQILIEHIGQKYSAREINVLLGLEPASTKIYAVLENFKLFKQVKQFETKPRTYKILPGIVKGWLSKRAIKKSTKPQKTKAMPPATTEQQMEFEVFANPQLEKLPDNGTPVDFGSAINSMIALREQNEKYKQALEMIANILHQAAPDLFE